MGVSFKSSSTKPVRSVSLPCSMSHPNAERIEKLLNNVKTWESIVPSSNPSADLICSGFSHLTALYECLEELFNTSLSHTLKWTDVLLDMSTKFLDISSSTTEILSQMKHQVREFECDLRRNGGCSSESIISKYLEFRNKLRKDIKGSMASLKQVNNIIRGCPFAIDSENYHMMWVVRVFKQVTTFSAVVFRLLLEFLDTSGLRRRQNGKWKAVSSFLSKSKVVPEDKVDTNVNELQRLDAALLGNHSSVKNKSIQVLPMNLEAVESTLEGINSHLHVLSRRMILTRVSILNMVSIY